MGYFDDPTNSLDGMTPEDAQGFFRQLPGLVTRGVNKVGGAFSDMANQGLQTEKNFLDQNNPDGTPITNDYDRLNSVAHLVRDNLAPSLGAPTGALGAGPKFFPAAADVEAGAGRVLPAGPAPLGIGLPAWHGSPHPGFDAFSNAFMGTGEGAQVKGWGHYLAEAEGTGTYYRDQLSRGYKFDGLSPEENQAIPSWATTRIKLANTLGTDPVTMARRLAGDPSLPPEAQAALAKLSKSDSIVARPSGSLYQLKFHADPSTLLDLDRPYTEQSGYVQDALKRAGYVLPTPEWTGAHSYRMGNEQLGRVGFARPIHSPGGDAPGFDWRAIAYDPKGSALEAQRADTLDAARALVEKMSAPRVAAGPTGEAIYKHLATNAANPRAASEGLDAAGIPGMRFLDQHSRQLRPGETATRNYVAFDPARIEILRRYGFLPPLAMAPWALGGNDQQ